MVCARANNYFPDLTVRIQERFARKYSVDRTHRPFIHNNQFLRNTMIQKQLIYEFRFTSRVFDRATTGEEQTLRIISRGLNRICHASDK